MSETTLKDKFLIAQNATSKFIKKIINKPTSFGLKEKIQALNQAHINFAISMSLNDGAEYKGALSRFDLIQGNQHSRDKYSRAIQLAEEDLDLYIKEIFKVK